MLHRVSFSGARGSSAMVLVLIVSGETLVKVQNRIGGAL
jgi:hypothetical protein